MAYAVLTSSCLLCSYVCCGERQRPWRSCGCFCTMHHLVFDVLHTHSCHCWDALDVVAACSSSQAPADSCCCLLWSYLLHACSPTFTLTPGATTYYCPESKELRATYSYTSKYVSDVFTGVSAYAFSTKTLPGGGTEDVIISDNFVDCSEYRQGECPGRCCRQAVAPTWH